MILHGNYKINTSFNFMPMNPRLFPVDVTYWEWTFKPHVQLYWAIFAALLQTRCLSSAHAWKCTVNKSGFTMGGPLWSLATRMQSDTSAASSQWQLVWTKWNNEKKKKYRWGSSVHSAPWNLDDEWEWGVWGHGMGVGEWEGAVAWDSSAMLIQFRVCLYVFVICKSGVRRNRALVPDK